MPNEGGNLLLTQADATDAIGRRGVDSRFIRSFVGSRELIHGIERRCIWVADEAWPEASENEWLASRFEAVRRKREDSDRRKTKELAEVPHRFGEVRQSGSEIAIIVPSVSSESRALPVGYTPPGTVVSNLAFALFDAPIWHLALIASRLHLVWIATVCGKLETRYRYSNTLGWNTFPVPTLTAKNRADLTSCAENILLAREAHFPATIADLHAPGGMPENLRAAHGRNDEVLERIYIGRRFQNDTERLEKPFGLYTKAAASETVA